jgi:hypothetical protein
MVALWVKVSYQKNEGRIVNQLVISWLDSFWTKMYQTSLNYADFVFELEDSIICFLFLKKKIKSNAFLGIFGASGYIFKLFF